MMPFHPKISYDLYIKQTFLHTMFFYSSFAVYNVQNNDNNLDNDTSNVFAIVLHKNYLEN